MIRHASPLLPGWLNEGLPEFYSTIALSGNKMHIGVSPSKRHPPATAGWEQWLNAGDLALGTRANGRLFYAESWALVHMLSLSPRFTKGMPEFIRLVTEGVAQEEAFPKAFGVSMDEALEAPPLLSQIAEVEITPALPLLLVEAPEKYQAARLSPLDAALALADLALRTDHPELARSLFEKIAKENPASPEAIAGLGAASPGRQQQGNGEGPIRTRYRHGIPQPTDLLRTGESDPRQRARLEKALAVDPDFAEAHFLLGVRFTDEGRFAAAIEHLEKAAALQPRRFTGWNALGFAQAKSGDRKNAAESARRAGVLAHTPEEERMAAGLTLLAAEHSAVRQKKPDVVTPPSWQNRKGDTRIEGALIEVDCDADPVQLLVSSGGKTIELAVRNPAEVVLLNAEGVSTTLVCGSQSLPVAAEYLAGSREVTRIEFKPVVVIKR